MATCTYNGVVFASLYRSKVSSRPIMDEAQRTTVYVEHSLEVEGYVVPNVVTGTTDTVLSTARKLLTAQGGALDYSDKGFGDLVVNVEAGGVRDVSWGPHPEILEWIPLGGDGVGTCKVVWRVTTRIPECTSAVYAGAPLALNYEQDFSIDEAGYTTVNTAGYIEIPMTRRTQTDRSLPDSADQYRERLQAAVPLGYRRNSQDYRLSKDKRRLDFSWTDEEIPTALPERVASIEARQSVSSAGGTSATRWQVTFDATITMIQGAAKSEALHVFLQLIGTRILGMQRAGGGKVINIPSSIRAEEDIFGRTSRFSITTIFIATQPSIGSFLAVQSQLWGPVPTDHSLWQTSLQPFGTHGTRGYNRAYASPASDGVIDLCVRRENALIANGRAPDKRAAGGNDAAKEADAVVNAILRNLKVSNSWLDYRVWLRYNERSGAVRHKLLLPADDGAARSPAVQDSGPPPPYVWGGRLGDDDSVRDQTGPGIAPAEGKGTRGTDPVQRPTSPSRRIWLCGYGVRLGYRVPVPRLVSVGGVTPIEAERWIEEQPANAIAGVPIYRTDWQIEYIVPSAPPGVVEVPANPILSVDGTTGVSGRLTP